jgi:hypothetical protein
MTQPLIELSLDGSLAFHSAALNIVDAGITIQALDKLFHLKEAVLEQIEFARIVLGDDPAVFAVLTITAEMVEDTYREILESATPS